MRGSVSDRSNLIRIPSLRNSKIPKKAFNFTTKEKITLYLKFAKHLAPKIFEDKTPKIHFEILDFVLSHDFSAVAVFRGAGKSTLLNRFYIETRYPADIPTEIDRSLAEDILAATEEMTDFVCDTIKFDFNSYHKRTKK